MLLFLKLFFDEFIAEMGDKTQLMLIALTYKFKIIAAAALLYFAASTIAGDDEEEESFFWDKSPQETEVSLPDLLKLFKYYSFKD